MTITSEFQSTRPVRGATHIVLAAHVNANISIHAPRAGRDNTTIKGRTKPVSYTHLFGPKKEYVETDFKPVEYRLGTTRIAFLSTDFASLRAKLLVRTTPMMENQAITEIKNELSTIHPFGERFVQSLFFEEKLADVLDERMEGFEKLQKELSAFADAVLVPVSYTHLDVYKRQDDARDGGADVRL